MNGANGTAEGGRVRWLEREGDDFPYYDGRPVALTGAQWIVVLIAVFIAFLALTLGPAAFKGPLLGLVPVFLYVAIPLVVLARVSRGHWKALFRRVGGRDVLLMFLFAILNLAVTLVVGSVLIRVTETTNNAVMASMGSQGPGDIVRTYLSAVPQLFGEELMSILPFLAFFYVLATRMKTGRGTAILLSWLLTGVVFAAAHLPTYGWNVVQTLGGVGVARLVLTLPYIRTKNIWVSTGAHILNDWLFFTVSILGTAPGAGG